MIDCPFCGASFDEEELVYEFNWNAVATFFYNERLLQTEPLSAYRDRAFYVTFQYDWRGHPQLDKFSPTVNPEKHPGKDPLRTAETGWYNVQTLLSRKHMFEIESADDDKDLPISASIVPMIRGGKKNKTPSAAGVSTGIFCPHCEQQLRADVLRAKEEVRILLCGRPGSGKTVYVTQALSELMQGRLANEFRISAANNAVQQHYEANKNLLRTFSNGFVLATNPAAVQDPYIFLLSNDKTTIRLVIQDVAGEDTENRMKYSTAVSNADMLLFFVDPWHIEEVRAFHRQNDDLSNDIVEKSTNGRYSALNGVFQQMMSTVDQDTARKTGQLAGVLLIKGDYLNPPMLSRGNQPECEMMRQPIPFNDPEGMEFSIGMRSSFIRQCLYEWNNTREFAREVEGKFSARNTRYFVASALGQSTHFRQTAAEEPQAGAPNDENPDAQFNVGGSAPKKASSASEHWNYGEQVLESVPRPENVLDPIFWCLKRRDIEF